MVPERTGKLDLVPVAGFVSSYGGLSIARAALKTIPIRRRTSTGSTSPA